MKRAMNAINRQFLIVSCPQRAASADDFRVAETPLVLLVPLVRSARGIM
ncbi:alcohol dehydrogenase [Burkholderia territorii]|nr:alcohol dehydrogenase [Burkholderia territorii]